jgi:hypothetical protein
LGCLGGGGIGILVVCCLGIAAVASLQRQAVESAPVPTEYDIEAIIEEDYINRSMETNTTGLPSPVPVVAAYLDVRPGGRGEFTARVRLGSFEPTIRGTAIMRSTPEGQLEVVLADVRLGYVPVTMFIPSGPIKEMNVAINQMMAERMGPLQARVIGVGGDETTLRFYLVADL